MRGPIREISDRGAARFETCLAQQVDLCCALEKLEDALPSRVDTRAAKLLAETLHETFHHCNQMEETFIFPVLLTAHAEVLSTIARLLAKHVEDEEQALRANKSETFDWLKFRLEGEGDRTHGNAFTDATFTGYRI